MHPAGPFGTCEAGALNKKQAVEINFHRSDRVE
ncbi:hypothetical protein GGR69_001883 [Xanthomonas arboricola]|nr:hypothetical protein [Xanthomonas arboricola]